MRLQHTIQAAAICEGVGVHTGAPASIRLAPAPANTGIVFIRVDFDGADARIHAHADNTSATMLGTTLKNESGAEVHTVEHLLSACAGLGVDNLYVAVEGPELPILDGSSAPFVATLLRAGLKAQGAPRRRIRIRDRIEVRNGSKMAALEPIGAHEEAEFDVTIRFEDEAIGVQRYRMHLTPEAFLEDIAQARTFGFMKDVEGMHAAGRGLGASMDNAIVVENGKVLNEEGLRFDDEFVRHKILDAIGDLALAGAPIAGRYVADQPGHALNAQLVRALLDAPHAWTWELETEVEPRRFAAAG